ncbi:glutaminase [Sphingomonas jejuensis]|uniref:Glutaminase n=1 Tax=Sphingomonas jejuensis TaxID=904715 RepID=A0ABX0XP46_9SPHN|nr:glutaminase [Sphingomonas jejuensis]
MTDPQPDTAALQSIVKDIAAEIARDAETIERSADAKDPDARPGPFGIAVTPLNGDAVYAGAADTPFPLQSIAKVFALDLALSEIGDDIFERVGREPSGDPFNSIIDLELNHGIPRNPFVNSGALAVVDILVERLKDPEDAVAGFVRTALKRDRVPYDDEVLASEKSGGDLNRAMMSFMRHHENLHSSIDDVMEAYVRQCAILLDVKDLAAVAATLAPTRLGGSQAENARACQTRKVLALMMTCGHYDGSGDFAVRVGLPAKSGVGGGIMAVVPEVAGIAVWSPNLDQHGNSILGVRGLEMLAARTGWSVFGPPRPLG